MNAEAVFTLDVHMQSLRRTAVSFPLASTLRLGCEET